MGSELEEQFYSMWQDLYPGIPLIREYRFADPRRFRFDFAHLETKTAIEIQGAIWVAGRHSRGSGLIKEHEKLNLAASMGWKIFYINSNSMDDPDILHLIAKSISHQG